MNKPDLNHLYQSNWEMYGFSPRSLLYPTWRRQLKSIRAVVDGLRIERHERPSFLDVGCGFGDFLTELMIRKCAVKRYHGIDPVEGFIEKARARHGPTIFGDTEEVRFSVGTLESSLEGTLNAGSYDYVVAIGVLAGKDSLHSLIPEMWKLTRKAMGFTFLNGRVYDGGLVGYDPLRVMSVIELLGSFWDMNASYGEGEVCVTVYREDQGKPQ